MILISMEEYKKVLGTISPFKCLDILNIQYTYWVVPNDDIEDLMTGIMLTNFNITNVLDSVKNSIVIHCIYPPNHSMAFCGLVINPPANDKESFLAMLQRVCQNKAFI